MAEEKRYEDVFAQLEQLVARIEDPERDLTTLREDIAKAMELIIWCRDYVRGNSEKIEEMMRQWQ